jgi:SAM-dependent methyltransferase
LTDRQLAGWPPKRGLREPDATGSYGHAPRPSRNQTLPAKLNRLEFLRQYVDVAAGRGLEVGPLANPVVTPDDGTIYYADHLSTEDLRITFADDPAVDVASIVPVDFVWGALRLAQAARDASPFDYAVASHVLEHVPDFVGWLGEIAEVLNPGGRLFLVLPDRRVTFDARRRATDLSQVVEAYLLGLRRPSVAASFDHFSRHVPVDIHAMWYGSDGYSPDTPINLELGWEAATRAARTDLYIDTHCWVFSDREFVELMVDLARLDLLDFRFAGFRPTQRGDMEFVVILERLDEALTRDAKTAAILGSLPDLRATFTVINAASPTLSTRQIALIKATRRFITYCRAFVGRTARRTGLSAPRIRRTTK